MSYFVIGFSFFLLINIFIISDIYRSSFKNKILDKIVLLIIILFSIIASFLVLRYDNNNIIFYLMTLTTGPVIYFMLSLGKKENLSTKIQNQFSTLKNIAVVVYGTISLTIITLTIKEANKYGLFFIDLFALTLVGVLSFHIIYPNYWDKFDVQKKL